MAFSRQAQAPGRAALRPVDPAVGLPPLKSVRLLDQLRERIRLLHYSLRTEEAYVYWARAYIRFHGLRHPAEMGKAEVEGFLTHLAVEKGLSASTHRQALSALIFLYDKVLGLQLPWLAEIGRPVPVRRLPVVLSRDEVAAVLDGLQGVHRVLARLLYGTGMRITEGLQLRVKDVDFTHRALIVREGKGGKDDAACPVKALTADLRDRQLMADSTHPHNLNTPRHPGYPKHPQNSRPAFAPCLATRLVIAPSHFGQTGAIARAVTGAGGGVTLAWRPD